MRSSEIVTPRPFTVMSNMFWRVVVQLVIVAKWVATTCDG